MALILKNSQKYFDAQQRELGRLNGHIEEIYAGHDIIKVYNATEEETEKFDHINNKLYIKIYRHRWQGTFNSLLY